MVWPCGKFELPDLTETNLKGNGGVSWFGVNDIIAGVQEKKSVAVLLKYVWHSAVIALGCVSSRTLWIHFKG